MKILAIIGATCSGKSNIALHLAKKINAYIFSIDSLSIFKQIDIASAKPSKSDLDSIKHFAINVLYPNEHVNAGIFLHLLSQSVKICKLDSKNLIIVGGSSFYLKSIIEGLSDIKSKNSNIESTLSQISLDEQYKMLKNIDSNYAYKISKNDKYRILKALEIYHTTGQIPTKYFKANPPKPFPYKITIFNLQIQRNILIEKINNRTREMLKNGLVEETKYILETYGENIQPFKSIGLKETLLYLQNKINKNDLESLISIHTRQLAKRQTTFNKTQFKNTILLDSNKDMESILDFIESMIYYKT